ncbi:MAG TPA: proton-conducting transporter membrane subunit, partial [Pirellulales bacterium]|nr:proton-conducting transporter membrane subunit [Pirellulales bacterium]
MGLLFLSTVSVLFLGCAVYSVGYLRREKHRTHIDYEDHLFFNNSPEAVFTGCMLLFLSSMTLVCTSQHFGLLWVGIEATTLASAPLIYFHRQHRSLEATWKYLLICSVGIALALMGTFLLAVATVDERTASGMSLVVSDLIAAAARLHVPWLKAAFLFFLVGYGTKMGLAPMHTWLPDAHSESPSVVSAMLSGALLNCAFLGILRGHQVCVAAGAGEFSQELLRVFGLLSMAIAAIFILGQVDFKRMLAYSSVEHMGILALGVGLGGAGAFGAGLHAINHSLTKACLFLVAGNILAVYETKAVKDISGVRRLLPLSGILWVAGFLAITGSPPFGTFLSEFTILKAALDGHYYKVAVAYLGLLALIFISMANIVLPMSQGLPRTSLLTSRTRESLWATLPPAALCLLVLVTGTYLPPTVTDMLHHVAAALGGN